MLRAVPRHEPRPAQGPPAPGVPSWADVFPYVNGGLFADDIGCPTFTRTSRAYLLRAGELDWKTINPDIFGSMIQAVADDDERGELGMHYTSRPEHPEGAGPALPRRPARAARGGGDEQAQALQPAPAPVAHPGVRPGLRVGQLPGHRLHPHARDRGRDHAPPGRGAGRGPRSPSPSSTGSRSRASRPRSPACRC